MNNLPDGLSEAMLDRYTDQSPDPEPDSRVTIWDALWLSPWYDDFLILSQRGGCFTNIEMGAEL